MRGLDDNERALMRDIDGDEPMPEYDAHREALAVSLRDRGLLVYVEEEVEEWPGLLSCGDDVTPLGRAIMWASTVGAVG
jgi:hypothetical protein